MNRFCIILLLIVTLLSCMDANAQRMPERHLVRKGNRQFKRERYDRSIDSYTRAVETAPTSFEASYNLANALFRTERYDQAEQTLKSLISDSLHSDIDRSEVFFNMGNIHFSQNKLQDALSDYRSAMRLNPDDQEAKYNYAYTKYLLQQQQQNDQQQNDKQNDKQQQNDQQQSKDDNQGNKNNQDKADNREQSGDGNEQDSQPQQPQSGIPEQQRDAMLNAIQAQEDKTQDKLKEGVGVVVRGGKNW